MFLKYLFFTLLIHNIKSEKNQLLIKPAPFNTDSEAISERDACDYNVKITQEMAFSHTAPRKIRVYADGIYDLFHSGHTNYLMRVKNLFPNMHLIVGVCNDELTRYHKGKTVMTDEERYEAVRHCKYVDEVLKNAPWEINDQFLIDNKIDFVTHDAEPYLNKNGDDIYKPLKDKGMFIGVERTCGLSTTDIISRIVRDYDIYVERNLKRGYTAKDLNVSFVKEKSIEIKNKLDEINNAVSKTKSDFINQWENKRKDLSDSYVSLFGRNGKISKYLKKNKEKLFKKSHKSKNSASVEFNNNNIPRSSNKYSKEKRSKNSIHDSRTNE